MARSSRDAPLAVLVAALLLLVAGCSVGQRPPTARRQAVAAANAFLDRYVARDGRVVRHDQGGDTVSEGQAYAMLLAEVAGRPEVADRVYRWSRTHLARPDGLLSYLAGPEGAVRDRQAASDADLLAAWALLRSGDSSGQQLAWAVQREETARVGALRLLAAGPWATGRPVTLDPSYWSPAPYRELARKTGDQRWAQMAGDAVTALSRLTAGGRRLPPDWARADGSTLSPEPAPDGSQPVPRYSYDAERTVVWMATACSAPARQLAASWAGTLTSGDPAVSARALDGSVLDPGRHPLPLVAAAAAAGAAGHPGQRNQLLDEAAALNDRSPTYYGAAWVALGRALLQTDLLDACDKETS